MTSTPRLYRQTDDRLVAGVASGVAAHLGVPVLAVRVAFIVLTPVNAIGAILYAVFWAVLSVAPDSPPPRPWRSRNVRQLLPLAALALGGILLASAAGIGKPGLVVGWLVVLIALGAGLIWHQADSERRWRRNSPGSPAGTPAGSSAAPWLGTLVAGTDRRGFLLRMIGGGALVAVGVIGSIAMLSPLQVAPFLAGLLYALLALAGVALVAAPMLWRMFSQLRAEREGRIRQQERAEVAAMVHDEVLHTLALIQRNAADERAVARLARGQERALRNWLYAPAASPSEKFSAAIGEAVAEVEDTYAVAVESVVVGDRDVCESISALVAASREALVNAARHSGVRTVSLYAEVEPHQSSVFVRDRGAGFDLTEVDHDRHGVRGSIIGRMRRHGGSAEIISEPGAGTEVRLIMPTPEGNGHHG